MKTDLENQATVPTPWAKSEHEVKPAEKIPAWAKPFVDKTAAQFLRKYTVHQKLEAMAGAMYGLVDLGVTVPECVKSASIQFWKNYIGKKPLRPADSIEDFGVLVVMVESFARGHFARQQAVKPPSKLERILGRLAKKVYSLLTRKIISALSHEAKAQFYTGCARGERIIERLQNPDHLAMVKLAPLYLAVSVAWRKILSLGTHAAREKWLKDEKVIKDNVSSREVYQAFEIIGLPGAKAGKPKQAET